MSAGASGPTGQVRWWRARRAASLKPATYRCPLCGLQLSAMSDHLLLFPEGDNRRRRHAHLDCVLKARERGELLLEDEWRRANRPQRSWRRHLPWARRASGGAPGGGDVQAGG